MDDEGSGGHCHKYRSSGGGYGRKRIAIEFQELSKWATVMTKSVGRLEASLPLLSSPVRGVHGLG